MLKPTVLIIDDERDLVELLRYTFTNEGFEVIAAYTGEAGFGAAWQHLPDVIILDVMLPGLDGFEICQLLRIDRRTRPLPLVLLTARSDESARKTGAALGADDFITKPFSPQALVTRVKELMSRGRRPSEPAEVSVP